MKTKFFVAVILAFLVQGLWDSRPALSQQRARTDSLLEFRTRRVPHGRIDLDARVMRARYRLRESTNTTGPDRVLREQAAEFGWSEDLGDLKKISDHALPQSRHVTYQQVYRGLPVDGRYVRVNLDRFERPTMVLSGYAPFEDDAGFSTAPAISATSVASRVRGFFPGQGGTNTEPELVVRAAGRPRLAWRVVVWPTGEPAEYVILMDAHTGEVLSQVDEALSLHRHLHGLADAHDPDPVTTPDANPGAGPSAWKTVAASGIPAPKKVTYNTDGSGLAYIPDPITLAGVPYGVPYVDGNDASNPSLDAARVPVTLRDISTDASGQFVLEGPYVSIVGENQTGATTYSPPRLAGPNDFNFDRSQLHFEAVNAYYHVDTSQRYVQSLGFMDRQAGPIPVNPHGLTSDDSFYFPNKNLLVFGSGGVDDAEDASVIWHEYGHALLQAAAPGLLGTTEGVALHEGWSDYWAASYARSLWETGKVGRSDWDRVFRWDSGDGTIWNGRVLDYSGHYPESTCSDDPFPTGCSAHNDGRLWGTVLMEIYSDIGKEATDELNLLSHAYLSAPTTFADAAEALIQADVDYNDGAHTASLINRLGSRGLIDANAFWPSVSSEPLAWIETTGGSTTVSAEALGISAPIESVVFRYEYPEGVNQSLTLSNVSGDRYEAELSLPDEPAVIPYYLEVTDEGARTTFLPATAPGVTYDLHVGPDTESPVVVHEPVTFFPFAAWPPLIEAEATDNLGVDHVSAGYRIEDLFGETLAEGTYELHTMNNEAFAGEIPVDQGLLPANVVVYYWLEGVDASQATNTTRLPAEGLYSFTAASEGVIRTLDFEADGPVVFYEGVWERDRPLYGLFSAHGGNDVAATAAQEAYPETAGVSSLGLGRVNLHGVGNAHLLFWHWYDSESDGDVDPNAGGAEVFDGGNVKISVDGGLSWAVAQPAGGYNAVVAPSSTNPMAGEPVFGGYSYGWRLVDVPLPGASDVRIRLDFGTDEGNVNQARWFAGWAVDDVQITTVLPEDEEAPSSLQLPATRTILPTTAPRPMVEAQFTDDIGVAEAVLEYSYSGRAGSETGFVRMELDPTTLTRYMATLDAVDEPSASDNIQYTFRIRDFSGHETRVPSNGFFEIEFWLIEDQSITSYAVGSGLWKGGGEEWTVDPSLPSGHVSSINLTPIDLPSNGTRLELVLSHAFTLSRDFGGNVKISPDGGRNWSVLEPKGGYPSDLNLSPDHPMHDEPAFTGHSSGIQSDRFDLGDFSGDQVRIRIDLATEEAPDIDDFWRIYGISYERATADLSFAVQREMTLHPVYPNPTSGITRIGYTVENAGDVGVEVYDMLGRRVRLVTEAYLEPGTYEKSLDTTGLAAGVYVVRMTAEGRQLVRTLSVVR